MHDSAPTLASAAPSAAILDIETEDPVGATGSGLSLGVLGWAAVGWLVLISLLALLAPILPLEDPERIGAGVPRTGPSADNWLGTDTGGRDIFSRVIWGARVPLLIAFVSVSAGLLIGGAIGIASGYLKGKRGRGLMVFTDLLLAFPALVLALALVALFQDRLKEALGLGPATLLAMLLAIAIISIPPLARVARANTLSVSEREYVLAAESIGAKPARIVTREILPNVAVSMVAVALLGMALAVVAEGGLAFLNLSVPDPTPTWGKMILDGNGALRDSPHISFVPIGALFLTVVSLNLLGDIARNIVDGRGPG